MSLLDQLHHRGVTTEDLEKAAAVRLFEKAASAEGVNLDELSEGDVNDLFNRFISANQSTKEASAMNDEIVELFEKTAAAEGIDLEDMSDEDLAELYNHYVENVLPEQIEAAEEEKNASATDVSADDAVVQMFQKTASAEGIDLSEFDQEELEGLFAHYVENVLPLQLDDVDTTDKVADAQEKLAEAEILGRHMARAYADEIQKVGGAREVADRVLGAFTGRRLRGAVKQNMDAVQTQTGSRGYRVRAGGDKPLTDSGKKRLRENQLETLKGLGETALAYGGTAGLAYGGKKMYDRKGGQEKRSGFSELEVDALLKIAAEGGVDAAADAKESLMDKAKRGGKYVDDKAQGLGKYIAGIGSGGAGRGGTKTHRALGYGAPALATAGLAYGGKKLYDRSKRGQEKQSSAVDYDDVVNQVALQMLAAAGYDV